MSSTVVLEGKGGVRRGREGGKAGGREGGKEGQREGGRDRGRRKGSYDSRREGKREEGGKEGWRGRERRSNPMTYRSLVEEVRKVSCGLWRDGDSSLSPDSLFSIVWRLVPQFR